MRSHRTDLSKLLYLSHVTGIDGERAVYIGMSLMVKAFYSKYLLLYVAPSPKRFKANSNSLITPCLTDRRCLPLTFRHDVSLLIALNSILKLTVITGGIAVMNTLNNGRGGLLIPTATTNDIKTLYESV